MSKPKPDPMLVSLNDAAALLGVSKRTLYRILERADQPLPAQRVGRNLRIKRTDLIAYFDNNALSYKRQSGDAA